VIVAGSTDERPFDRRLDEWIEGIEVRQEPERPEQNDEKRNRRVE